MKWAKRSWVPCLQHISGLYQTAVVAELFTKKSGNGKVLLIMPMSPPLKKMQMMSSGGEADSAVNTDQFCI